MNSRMSSGMSAGILDVEMRVADQQGKALQQLQQLAAEAELIDLTSSGTRTFREWELKVDITLSRLFGENSPCVKRFRALDWLSTRPTTEVEEALWLGTLDAARGILRTAVADARDFAVVPEKIVPPGTIQAYALAEVHRWPRPVKLTVLLLGLASLSVFALWNSLPPALKERLLPLSGRFPAKTETTAPSAVIQVPTLTSDLSATHTTTTVASTQETLAALRSELDGLLGTWNGSKEGDVGSTRIVLTLSPSEHPAQLFGDIEATESDGAVETVMVEAIAVQGQAWIEFGRVQRTESAGDFVQSGGLLAERYLVYWRDNNTIELRNRSNTTQYFFNRIIR